MNAAVQPDIGLFDWRPSLKGIGTRDCEEWRDKIIRRHWWVAKVLSDAYQEEYRAGGHVAANVLLRKVEESLKLHHTGLYCDAGDETFKDYAKAKAAKVERLFWETNHRLGKSAAVAAVIRDVEKTGYQLPGFTDKKSPARDDLVASLARVFDAGWWRRNLRRDAGRQLEQVCRELGLVHKRASVYVSEYTVERRRSQKARNRNLLLSLEAVNEDGYSATLQDMSDKSVSNPVNRRCELMVRMRGYEEIAQKMGYVGVFTTLTAPSKYHAITKGKRNRKYNGATPSEVQKYLAGVWAKVRAAWQRAKLGCFGFRFAEPHHDGTPHWHQILFFRPDDVKPAMRILKRYALKVDGGERGAGKYRFQYVLIDRSRGTATGYVAKYVSKNIDGFSESGDLVDDEAEDFASSTAKRVEAWASTWGIRQFQQIGNVSVTVWRELRKAAPDDLDCEAIAEVREAADSGDWSRFCEVMGGPMVKRAMMRVRAWVVSVAEVGRYGEQVKKLIGVISDVSAACTRVHRWTVRAVRTVAEDWKEYERHAPAWGSHGPPSAGRLDLCQ